MSVPRFMVSGFLYRVDETAMNDKGRFSRKFILMIIDSPHNKYVQFSLKGERDVQLVSDFELNESVVVEYELNGYLWDKDPNTTVCVNDIRAVNVMKS